VTITDDQGNTIAITDSPLFSFIDHVTLANVPVGRRLRAVVTLASSGHVFAKKYRLVVIGSSPYIARTDIAGAHQVAQLKPLS